MNAINDARNGYLQNMTSTKSARRMEYEVVARVTHRLRDAANNARRDYPGYVAALEDNRQLWQIFALEVIDKDNPLPEDLKARILYLAEFSNLHTKKILREKVSALPLLEINMAILRGLKNESIDR